MSIGDRCSLTGMPLTIRSLLSRYMPFFFSEMLPRFWPFENAWVGVVSLACAEVRVLENDRTHLRMRFCPAKFKSLAPGPDSFVKRKSLIRAAISLQ